MNPQPPLPPEPDAHTAESEIVADSELDATPTTPRLQTFNIIELPDSPGSRAQSGEAVQLLHFNARLWVFIACGIISAGIIVALSLRTFAVPARSSSVALTTGTPPAGRSTATPGSAVQTPTATQSSTGTAGPGTPSSTPPTTATAVATAASITPTHTPTATMVPTGTPITVTSITTVDDATQGAGNDQFNYSGAWQHLSNAPSNYDGTLSQGASVGDTARITFTGNRIQIFATKGPNLGIVGFILDGGMEVTVDQYAVVTIYDQLLFDSNTLPSASHTCTILFTGSQNQSSTGNMVSIDDAVIQS